MYLCVLELSHSNNKLCLLPQCRVPTTLCCIVYAYMPNSLKFTSRVRVYISWLWIRIHKKQNALDFFFTALDKIGKKTTPHVFFACTFWDDKCVRWTFERINNNNCREKGLSQQHRMKMLLFWAISTCYIKNFSARLPLALNLTAPHTTQN